MNIIPPDVEPWLCEYIREHIQDVPGLQAGRRKPDRYDGSFPLVTVRDDGGGGDGIAAYALSVGVNVYGGTRGNPKPCKDLARRVFALLTSPDVLSTEGSPFMDVDAADCMTPYGLSDDPGTAHYYMIVSYTAIGEEFQDSNS